jgi:putative transposase
MRVAFKYFFNLYFVMQRVVSLSLPVQGSLLRTIHLYNEICNFHIQKALALNTLSKSLLHKELYSKIRQQYTSFPSALIQCARDQAVEMLKGNKNCVHTKKKKTSSIRFDQRTCKVFLESGHLSITTVEGRKKYLLKVPDYFSKYFSWKVKGITLGLREKGRLLLKIIVEGEKVPPSTDTGLLGIDLGLNNFVFMSNGQFLRSTKIRAIKRKYSYLRKRLQSCGTRSAKRKLKRLRGRERRFMRDFNHQLSKQIVALPYGCYALENLKSIRKGRKGKRFNRMRSNWTYYQFRQLLQYKAEDKGKTIMLVDPRYTSQRCCRCGFTKKANRNKDKFKCKKCSLSLPADFNASINISQRGKALIEQAVVNQPNVTIDERQRIRSRC